VRKNQTIKKQKISGNVNNGASEGRRKKKYRNWEVKNEGGGTGARAKKKKKNGGEKEKAPGQMKYVQQHPRDR